MITNIIILLQCSDIATVLFREIARLLNLPVALVRVPFRACGFRATLIPLFTPLLLLLVLVILDFQGWAFYSFCSCCQPLEESLEILAALFLSWPPSSSISLLVCAEAVPVGAESGYISQWAFRTFPWGRNTAYDLAIAVSVEADFSRKPICISTHISAFLSLIFVFPL